MMMQSFNKSFITTPLFFAFVRQDHAFGYCLLIILLAKLSHSQQSVNFLFANDHPLQPMIRIIDSITRYGAYSKEGIAHAKGEMYEFIISIIRCIVTIFK